MVKFDSNRRREVYNNILGKNVYTIITTNNGEIMLYGRVTNIRFLVDDCLVTIQTPFYPHICSYKNIIVSNNQELSYGDEVTYNHATWCISDIKPVISGMEPVFFDSNMCTFQLMQKNLVLTRQGLDNNLVKVIVPENNVQKKCELQPFHIIIEPNKEELAEKIISELPFDMFYEKLYNNIHDMTGVLYTFHKRDFFDTDCHNFSDKWYMNVMSGHDFGASEYVKKSTLLCYPLEDEDEQ